METNISRSETETKKIAAEMVKRGNRCICLFGDLGAGKTVFAKGIAEAFGIAEDEIKSPTYTFVRQYELNGESLYHFDFYRIESLDDVMEHDIREILSKNKSYFIIEWAERIKDVLPEKRADVQLEYVDENTRKITIHEHDNERN